MILKKIVTTEVAYNNKNVFLIVLEAAKSKIKSLIESAFGKGPFLIQR
jgi:ribosomal protein L23